MRTSMNFDELRNSGCYYVDKTELLYELRQDSKNIVTLFTRPRRFGKTLTLRMMDGIASDSQRGDHRYFRDRGGEAVSGAA